MNSESILSFSNRLRQGNCDYISNAFFTLPQLEEKLRNPNVTVAKGEDVLLILEEEDVLLRMFFYARNAKSLSRIAVLLPHTSKQIVADIVGRAINAKKIAASLYENGFQLYNTFIRMTCKQPVMPRITGVDMVDFAKPEEAGAIRTLLLKEFDPLFSHIPDESALAAAAKKQEITVCRAEGQIAGLAYFEEVSQKYSVLRYFLVRSEYRGRNHGGALLAHAFLRHDEHTVYMLWIGTYNTTQELYKRLGFSQDGLCDYILLYKGV